MKIVQFSSALIPYDKVGYSRPMPSRYEKATPS